MRTTKSNHGGLKITALLAVAAFALAGCAAATDDDSGDGGVKRISVAWNQSFYSYNTNTSAGNNVTNANVAYLTNTAFNYYDNKSVLQKNEQFGTYTLLSQDPPVVKYTINEGVTWSDGTPIDAADLLLEWVANSGARNTKGFTPQSDADGNPIADPANVYFDGSIGAGLENVAQTPEIGDNGRSITLKYDKPSVDWELNFWNGAQSGVAAHVVAQKALGIPDSLSAKTAVIKAIQDNDTAKLSLIASFWNTGFGMSALPSDPSLYLSSGAYVISDFVADQYLTVKRNEKYTWGPKPKYDEITIRFIPDAMAQVTALQNGEVDVIQPQATADVLTATKALSGITISSGNDASYEHLDLQFANSKNPGVFEDKRVREAFLKTIPRQEIIDKLITPLNPEAQIRNSFTETPGSPRYTEMVNSNGLAKYDVVDISGAKELLAQAGKPNPTVCLLYASNNPRRVNEFQLIQASAALAGISVTDCGSQQWSSLLGSPGAYDAALYAWQNQTTGVAESAATYRSGGINNHNFYSSALGDLLWDQLQQSSDPTQSVDLKKRIEKSLVDDAYGLTLFQFPTVTASRESIKNIAPSVLVPGYFWNFWEWDNQ
ncbi:MAG: ABC transporter family substrate-binding protein [Mycobacteriaceae bacterium]